MALARSVFSFCLRALDLSKTKVTGNIEFLKYIKYLEVADFSSTKVSGSIAPGSWGTCCQKLRSLKVSNTSVSLSFGQQSFDDLMVTNEKFWLPKLKYLDMSSCLTSLLSIEQLLHVFICNDLCSTLFVVDLPHATCCQRGAKCEVQSTYRSQN